MSETRPAELETMDGWLSAVAQVLSEACGEELALSRPEIAELLDVARVAAHESGVRADAPLACYLVGRAAASGGASVSELAAVLRAASAAWRPARDDLDGAA